MVGFLNVFGLLPVLFLYGGIKYSFFLLNLLDRLSILVCAKFWARFSIAFRAKIKKYSKKPGLFVSLSASRFDLSVWSSVFICVLSVREEGLSLSNA